jgi:hypothetical protein
MSLTLGILEDTSQLPRCPRCHVEVKMRRYNDRWLIYELSPMNKVFLGQIPGLLVFNGDFVFVPHALCCGSIECPTDPGLARLWERNNERLSQSLGNQREHVTYGMVSDVSLRDVASRLHIKVANSRGLTITKSDAVAILDFFANCGVEYVGGPILEEAQPVSESVVISLPQTDPEPAPNQCTAISSKTKKRCTQRTNDSSGKCFAHRDKPGLSDQGVGDTLEHAYPGIHPSDSGDSSLLS